MNPSVKKKPAFGVITTSGKAWPGSTGLPAIRRARHDSEAQRIAIRIRRSQGNRQCLLFAGMQRLAAGKWRIVDRLHRENNRRRDGCDAIAHAEGKTIATIKIRVGLVAKGSITGHSHPAIGGIRTERVRQGVTIGIRGKQLAGEHRILIHDKSSILGNRGIILSRDRDVHHCGIPRTSRILNGV